ncbi:hypothetical protein J6590_091423 [Homalodisca vitripennis]|nr:hypothetical protein J6590_091423 [Homalodisca vitripennis]
MKGVVIVERRVLMRIAVGRPHRHSADSRVGNGADLCVPNLREQTEIQGHTVDF